jgi:hypothetical protein
MYAGRPSKAGTRLGSHTTGWLPVRPRRPNEKVGGPGCAPAVGHAPGHAGQPGLASDRPGDGARLWAGCPIRFEHRWDAFGNGAHESQRAWVAAKIENMRQGERTDLEPSANLHKVDRKAAATMLNVSERSFASAAVVRDKATPEPQAAVEQDHSAARSPPGRHQMALRLGDACLRGSLGDQQCTAGSGFMDKASKRYLATSVSVLVAAILFSLVAILVRGVVAPEMDGKMTADATVLELRKSLP